MMTRVLNLITSLDVGGAEMMLLKVVSGLDRSRFDTRVVSLLPAGEVGRMMEDAGIPVESLELQRGRAAISGLGRFLRICREFRPHVMMTWLYHADLLGALSRPFFPKTALAWNLRCANMDFSRYAPLTGRVVKANALFSFIPSVVVANSSAGLLMHRQLGYRPRRTEIIENGFDTSLFRPDVEARKLARAAWGISDDAPVVGLFARFDPMKGHGDFFRAAGILSRKMPAVHFVLCGQGVTPENPEVSARIRENGLDRACVLLGPRSDMPGLYPGLDLLCSPSLGEGFPNVVGEAMSSGVPCVVTDVGDCREVVGDTGFTVPPGSPEEMADSLSRLLEMPEESRLLLGQAARKRIETRYSIASVVDRYEKLYASLAAGSAR
ncbi:MAG: glycosyltransferase [Deltaproteobacteria bacterium]|nr:glycosyltransferase [Deltaproteobacteria bacterium]